MIVDGRPARETTRWNGARLLTSIPLSRAVRACRYVKRANASQHDLFSRIIGRQAPLTAQIKTHASADAARYAHEMVGDYRSVFFVVPDDHVDPLREHWRSQLRGFEGHGQILEATEARRQLARVRGLGTTLKELDAGVVRASRFSLREQNATYISLGAGIAMALGPDLWEWSRTGKMSNHAMLRLTRAGSIMAAERATVFTLSRFRTGALQGGLRGNALIALAVLGTDTAFSLYENGGAQAFRAADFYTRLGGGIGGVALGVIVGVPVAVVVTMWTVSAGPRAVPMGGLAGMVAGGVAGAAGYIGGETATRTILEVIDPAFLHDAEHAMIVGARDGIAQSIELLRVDMTR